MKVIKRSLFNRMMMMLMMIGVLFSTSTIAGSAEQIRVVVDDNIKIVVNGSPVQSDVPPATANDRLLLPVSVIFKALGADVTWDAQTKTVTAVKEEKIIKLSVGAYHMRVNDAVVELEVPALIVSNRVLIPVRAVAEAMSLEVLWHDAENTAELRDSFYSAKNHSLNVAGKSFYIGQTESDVISLLGEPQRKDPSEQGFLWSIYNANYAQYIQVGIKNGKVVALYTNAKGFAYDSKITQGMSEEALSKNTTSKEEGQSGNWVAYADGCQINYFVDLHDQLTLSSILLMEYETSQIDPYYLLKGDYLKRFVEAQERQIMDLGNAIRARKNLPLFAWNDQIAGVARLHSQDMAKRDYFDHINPDGKSPFDRMEAGGIRYSAAAENIAVGYSNAIFAHEAWMNSLGHRKALLGSYARFGGGVYYHVKDDVVYCYYTENFYTPR